MRAVLLLCLAAPVLSVALAGPPPGSLEVDLVETIQQTASATPTAVLTLRDCDTYEPCIQVIHNSTTAEYEDPGAFCDVVQAGQEAVPVSADDVTVSAYVVNVNVPGSYDIEYTCNPGTAQASSKTRVVIVAGAPTSAPTAAPTRIAHTYKYFWQNTEHHHSVSCPANHYYWGVWDHGHANSDGSANLKGYCGQCPAGTASAPCINCVKDPMHKRCIAECQAGTFHERKECVACEAGQFQFSTGKHFCHQCFPGMFQANEGQQDCTSCAEGKYQEDRGGSSCNDCAACPAGQWGLTNHVGAQNATDCTCSDCGPGTYSPEAASECFLCTPGHVSATGDAACTPCAIGTFESGNECVKCAVGRSTPAAGSPSAADCSVEVTPTCDAGKNVQTTHVGGQVHHRCLNCQSGTYGVIVQGLSECVACVEGKFQPHEGRTECGECRGTSVVSADKTDCMAPTGIPTAAPTAEPTSYPTAYPSATPTDSPTIKKGDCWMGDWSQWGDCTEECGSGVKPRSRHIILHGQGGGLPCPTELEESENCNVHPCPIDCKYQWHDWGDCSVTCGEGHRSRALEIMTAMNHSGLACPQQLEQQVCQRPPCPPPTTNPTTSPTITPTPVPTGRPTSPTNTPTKNPTISPTHTPSSVPTPKPMEKDCIMGEWEEGACEVTCGVGLQTDARVIVRAAEWGGVPCGNVTREEPCDAGTCPIDCVQGDWTTWSTCDRSCNSGNRYRNRTYVTQPNAQGAACGVHEMYKVCNDEMCPLDCEVGDWASWTQCTHSCSGGKEFRHRGMQRYPRLGGAACPALLEGRVCASQACDTDCTLTPWSAWTVPHSNCGPAMCNRTRSIDNDASGNGQCGALIEERSCNEDACPEDCDMGDWGAWTDSAITCGGAIEHRTRSINTVGRHGGVACGRVFETRTIATAPCPVDCVTTSWHVHNDCHASCGTTVMKTSRKAVEQYGAYGGQSCGLTEKVEACHNFECPVDCEVSGWGEFSTCTLTCGGVGTRTRDRSQTRPYAAGGAACPPLRQELNCDLGPCHGADECTVGEWGNWGTCDISCGGGVKTRVRHVDIVMHDVYKDMTEMNTGLERIGSTGGGYSRVNLGKAAYHHEGNVHDRAAISTVAPEHRRLSENVISHGEHRVHGVEHTGPLANWNLSATAEDTVQNATAGQVHSINQVNTKTSEFKNSKRTVAHQLARSHCPKSVDMVPCSNAPCPVDCVMSGYWNWTDCTRSCGGGHRTRVAEVLVQPAYNGQPCIEAPVRTEGCGMERCPTDCMLSDFGPMTPCSVSCGGGIRLRHRSIDQESAFGGKICPSQEKTEECNEHACPIDCTVSAWSEWDACPTGCGGHIQQRIRNVTENTAFGGTHCPTRWQERSCGEPCTNDCAVGDWEPWTTCTASCGGGMQRRTRFVEQYASNGGNGCPELVNGKVCNAHECTRDCEEGDWSTWGTCTVSCLADHGATVGVHRRTRSVLQQATGDGTACGKLFGTEPCRATEPCPRHCRFGDWNAWSDCVAPDSSLRSCGGGGSSTRTRDIIEESDYGGSTCPHTEESDPLCGDDDCPVDCLVGDWSDYGGCTHSCGTGQKHRTRNVTQWDLNNGEVCPALDGDDNCNTQLCPVDCEQGDWGSYYPCSTTCGNGTKFRFRHIKQNNLYGGKECGAPMSDAPCPGTCCPVDGEWNDFKSWDHSSTESCPVSCGGADQTRYRTVKHEPFCGGQALVGNETEVQRCEEQVCPTDCNFTVWRWVSDCTVTCGVGSRTQVRTINHDPTAGGAACPHLLEHVPCDEGLCPVHCETSLWSPFSDCSTTCGQGTMLRTRTIVSHPEHGGYVCPALEELLNCHIRYCPVDCAVGDWDSWTECSDSCGGGTQIRERHISTLPLQGGVACPTIHELNPNCRAEPCPIDCDIGDWGAWGACDLSCGGGNSKRTRDIYTNHDHGGVRCGDTEDNRPCAEEACARDCEIGEYSAFGECDQTCGSGMRVKSREIINQPVNGGKECPPAWVLNFAEVCETQECPQDCIMGDWGDYFPPSVTCGAECRRIRFRRQEQEGLHGGQMCADADGVALPEIETGECDAATRAPCPIDCLLGDWGVWSGCSSHYDTHHGSGIHAHPCASPGAHRTRHRGIIHPNNAQGTFCPKASELVEFASNCGNLPACPEECETKIWGAWGPCHATCKTPGAASHVHRSRYLNTTASVSVSGGPCPAEGQAEICGALVDCTEAAAFDDHQVNSDGTLQAVVAANFEANR